MNKIGVTHAQSMKKAWKDRTRKVRAGLWFSHGAMPHISRIYLDWVRFRIQGCYTKVWSSLAKRESRIMDFRTSQSWISYRHIRRGHWVVFLTDFHSWNGTDHECNQSRISLCLYHTQGTVKITLVRNFLLGISMIFLDVKKRELLDRGP